MLLLNFRKSQADLK